MPHAVEESDTPNVDQIVAIGQLRQMIEEGRSFSGNEKNCSFLNTGGRNRFATVSAVSGLDYDDDGRALVSVDWDQDGDLDLWTSNRNGPRLRLLRNDNSTGHHFLRLRLQGNGKSTSRDAIGARVIVETSGRNELTKTLRAGEGFLSQSSKWLHFGIGSADDITSVKVQWPGGDVESFTGCGIDGRFVLVQGSGKADPLLAANRELSLKAEVQKVPPATGTMRVPMTTLLPMPTHAKYRTFDGFEKQIPYRTGKPTLILFYASWCSPCREELQELVERQDELQKVGVEVVALAVDGLDDDSSAEDAEQLCKHLKVPFISGRAKSDFAQLMTGYHHMLVALKRPLPVPVSFLIDGEGRLSVIYKGRLSVDDLLKDAQSNPKDLRERWVRAAPFSGRTIEHDGLLQSLVRREANIRVAMGNWFFKSNRLKDAWGFYDSGLALEPDFGVAHQGLALVLHGMRSHEKAAVHYEMAIEHLPTNPLLHYNLGNIYSGFDKLDKAEACYNAALELKPDYKEAQMNLGVVLMKKKDYKRARKSLERVLEIDPSFRPALQLLKKLEQVNSP